MWTNEERKQKVSKIIRICKQLPEKKQRAVVWLIENMDGVNQWLKESTVGRKEWEENMAWARETGDDLLELLLLYQEVCGYVRED